MSFDNFFEEVKEKFNYEEKKQEFIDNLDMLKSMWKEKVRDVNKSSKEPTKTKANKMSRATKRHLRNQNKK